MAMQPDIGPVPEEVTARQPGETPLAYYSRLAGLTPADFARLPQDDLKAWFEGYQASVMRKTTESFTKHTANAFEEHYAATLKSPRLRELFELSTGLHANRA